MSESDLSEKVMQKCSKCGKQHRRKGQRLCHACHAENMRKWRAGRVYVSRETYERFLADKGDSTLKNRTGSVRSDLYAEKDTQSAATKKRG